LCFLCFHSSCDNCGGLSQCTSGPEMGYGSYTMAGRCQCMCLYCIQSSTCAQRILFTSRARLSFVVRCRNLDQTQARSLQSHHQLVHGITYLSVDRYPFPPRIQRKGREGMCKKIEEKKRRIIILALACLATGRPPCASYPSLIAATVLCKLL